MTSGGIARARPLTTANCAAWVSAAARESANQVRRDRRAERGRRKTPPPVRHAMHAGSSRATSYGKSRRLATDLDIRAIVGAVPPSYADACRHLARDPAMRALIRRHGPCGLAPARLPPDDAPPLALALPHRHGRPARAIHGRYLT